MISAIFTVVVLVLAVSLLAWLIISPPVFIWWFYDTETRDQILKKHENVTIAVYIGTFISFIFVLIQGLEQVFVFIPPDWGGYDEDGDFVSTRYEIACIMAIFISFFFIHVFCKFDKLHTENKRLSYIAEIKKRTDGLRYLSREYLIERRNETKAEMQKLRDSSYDSRRPTEIMDELWILDELLDELECRIRLTEASDTIDE